MTDKEFDVFLQGALIKCDLSEYFKEYYVVEEHHDFSEKFEKKMKRIIRNSECCGKTMTKQILKRIIVCAACILVAAGFTVFSVKAWRERVVNYIIELFSDHAEISFDYGGDINDHPTEIEKVYEITALPPGFELAEDLSDEIDIWQSYKNDSNYIDFKQYTYNIGISYDNNNAEFQEITDDILGKYLVYHNWDYAVFLWNNDDYIFIIESDLSDEEILDVCRSVKEKSQ